MIPTTKKILLACDLSTSWEYALAYAIYTSQKYNAELVLLHVIEPIADGTRMWMDLYVSKQRVEDVLHNYKKRATAMIQEKIKQYVQDTTAQLKFDVILEEGYPADVILSKIDELNCDLIIMGNHGKGHMTYAFLGSVAERVVRRVKKPILIVPHP
ncbi:MAG: universal stress protein [Syntrophales bacterium]|nr:universal stress protein [Syntrophales bacterium]MDX9922871.1 universal stress protein [Syntrophales bacterium]